MVGVVGIVFVVSPRDPRLGRLDKLILCQGRYELAGCQILGNLVGRPDRQAHRSEGRIRAKRRGDDAVSADKEIGELPDLGIEVGNGCIDVVPSKTAMSSSSLDMVNTRFSYPCPARTVPPRWRAKPGLYFWA
jgi:hypothetical protein